MPRHKKFLMLCLAFGVLRSAFSFFPSLAFELIELIDIGAAVVPIDGDDEGKSDRGLRRSDSDGKDRDHYSNRWLWLRAEAPEGDEVQVRGREHQLDSD